MGAKVDLSSSSTSSQASLSSLATLSSKQFIVIIVLTLAVFSRQGTCQDFTVKQCLGSKEGDKPGINITLSCQVGQTISLEEAIFSRNNWSICVNVVGDCVEHTEVFNTCEGRQSCTVPIRGTYTRKCGYANFLRVIYDCVTEIRIPDEDSFVNTDPKDDPQGNRDTPPPSQSTDRTRQPYTPWATAAETGNDTALIAGCAVAVVITTVVLVIAIILVVRRLIGFDDSDDNGPGSKKPHVLTFLHCTKFACGACGKPRSEREQDDLETGRHDPTSTARDLEDRLTPIGASAEPSVEDPTPGTSAPPTTVPTSSVTSSSDSQRPRSFDAVAIPNTETATSC